MVLMQRHRHGDRTRVYDIEPTELTKDNKVVPREPRVWRFAGGIAAVAYSKAQALMMIEEEEERDAVVA